MQDLNPQLTPLRFPLKQVQTIRASLLRLFVAANIHSAVHRASSATSKFRVAAATISSNHALASK